MLNETELKDLVVLQAHRLVEAQATIASQAALLERARDRLGSFMAKIAQLEAAAVPAAPLPTSSVSTTVEARA